MFHDDVRTSIGDMAAYCYTQNFEAKIFLISV